MNRYLNFLPLTATPAAVLSVMLSVMLAVTTAAADEIAYVDARKLIDQAPQGADILKELEAEFAERSRGLKGRLDKFQAEQQDLEKKSLQMTAEKLQAKTRELQQQERQLVRDRRDYKEDFDRRRNQRLRELEKIITEVIITVAKKQKLDVVFQQEQVVYASPKVDITDRVLGELKKRHKK